MQQRRARETEEEYKTQKKKKENTQSKKRENINKKLQKLEILRNQS